MSQLSPTETLDVTKIDLFDPKWHDQGAPHELFAALRDAAPLHRFTYPDGGTHVSMTRHADVAAVSRDTATFSSSVGGVYYEPDHIVPLELSRNQLLFKDPPEHTRYRLIMQTAFTPHAVAKMEADIRARVTRLIDGVIEAGECDFVTDIAVPLPLGVLAEMMGFPADTIPQMYEWTEQLEAASRATEPAAALPMFGELATFLAHQIEKQAAAGGDSLVTRLRAAEVNGERLNDDEILLFFVLLLFAGNDTTRNTSSVGTKLLCEHPDAYAAMTEDPARIPATIEEILRMSSVVKYFCRTATKDTEIDGFEIAKGEKVVMWYTAASRDPQVFTDPDRLDPTRDRLEHKAFGGGGRHFCLGAGLARLQLRVLFEEVSRRMPGLQLAGEPEWVPSSWVNSLRHLPVSFTPGPRVL